MLTPREETAREPMPAPAAVAEHSAQLGAQLPTVQSRCLKLQALLLLAVTTAPRSCLFLLLLLLLGRVATLQALVVCSLR